MRLPISFPRLLRIPDFGTKPVRTLSLSDKLGGTDGKKRGSKTKGSRKSVPMQNNSVKHEPASTRFTMDLGGNQIARIDYKPIGKNKIELYHTEVPSELRGRGIGKALAKGTLEHASNDSIKVKLTCSYLVNYMDKCADPKYKKLLTK